MKYLRGILGVTRRDRINNDTITGELNSIITSIDSSGLGI